MDNTPTLVMITIGVTVLMVLLLATLWRLTSWKTRLTLFGLAALPFGLFLGGLTNLLIGAYISLHDWWGGLAYTMDRVIGLSLLGVAALALVLGRLVPYRPAKRKSDRTPTPPSVGPSQPSSAPSTPTTTYPTYQSNGGQSSGSTTP